MKRRAAQFAGSLKSESWAVQLTMRRCQGLSTPEGSRFTMYNIDNRGGKARSMRMNELNLDLHFSYESTMVGGM